MKTRFVLSVVSHSPSLFPFYINFLDGFKYGVVSIDPMPHSPIVFLCIFTLNILIDLRIVHT